jgi:chemotaxis response regulator CheB
MTIKTKGKGTQQSKTPGGADRKTTLALPPAGSFPIVGLGTSAGGLEALEHFLSHVPIHSGMAFVIVQHLDPTRKGIMPAQIHA